jgi:hypothetical protein
MKAQKTQHEAKAAQFGLHPNVVSALQRRGVVPRRISDFSPEDELFLQKLGVIISDHRLLKMQLSRKTQQARAKLFMQVHDFDLRRWERYALKRFSNLYRAGTQRVRCKKIFRELQGRFGVKDTPQIRRRVQQIRRMAATRVGRERLPSH